MSCTNLSSTTSKTEKNHLSKSSKHSYQFKCNIHTVIHRSFQSKNLVFHKQEWGFPAELRVAIKHLKPDKAIA